MPPAQCPECGRFLAQAFVLGLATQSSDCPKCGTRLSAAQFADRLGQAAAPEGPAEEPAGAADLRQSAPPDPDPVSVRPPDLDPGSVRGGPGEALAGWDTDDDGRVLDLDRHRTRQPPPDAAIVAGSGVAGAVLGALLARPRWRGALLGLVAGVAAAGTARRVWRLPD